MFEDVKELLADIPAHQKEQAARSYFGQFLASDLSPEHVNPAYQAFLNEVVPEVSEARKRDSSPDDRSILNPTPSDTTVKGIQDSLDPSPDPLEKLSSQEYAQRAMEEATKKQYTDDSQVVIYPDGLMTDGKGNFVGRKEYDPGKAFSQGLDNTTLGYAARISRGEAGLPEERENFYLTEKIAGLAGSIIGETPAMVVGGVVGGPVGAFALPAGLNAAYRAELERGRPIESSSDPEFQKTLDASVLATAQGAAEGLVFEGGLAGIKKFLPKPTSVSEVFPEYLPTRITRAPESVDRAFPMGRRGPAYTPKEVSESFTPVDEIGWGSPMIAEMKARPLESQSVSRYSRAATVKEVRGSLEAMEKMTGSPVSREVIKNYQYSTWIENIDKTLAKLDKIGDTPIISRGNLDSRILANSSKYDMAKLSMPVRNHLMQWLEATDDLSIPQRGKQFVVELYDRQFRSWERSLLNQNNPTAAKLAPLVNREVPELVERTAGEFKSKFRAIVEGLTTEQEVALRKLRDRGIQSTDETVLKANTQIKELTDLMHKRSLDSGMTERTAQTANWNIIKDEKAGKWILQNESGEVVGEFTSKRAAEVLEKTYRDIPIQKLENYFPRDVNFKEISRRRKETVKHLIDTGQVDRAVKAIGKDASPTEVAIMKLNIFARRNSERRTGHLNYSRELDLPEWAYNTDLKSAYERYINRWAQRTVEAEVYGPKDELLKKMVQEIGETGGDAIEAQRYLDRVFGRDNLDPKGRFIHSTIRAYQVTKLVLSAPGQFGQHVQTMENTSLMAYLQSFVKPGLTKKTAEDFVLRAGTGDQWAQAQARRAATGESDFAEAFLNFVQFTRVDRSSRFHAALAGKYYVEHLARKLEKNPKSLFVARRLPDFGLDSDTLIKQGFKLTDEQKLIAAQKCEIALNYRSRIGDLPSGWTSEGGRTWWQFGSFNFQRSKFLRDVVIREAGHGNPMPLVYWAAGGQLSGQMINTIRDTANGRTPSVDFMRNFAAAGSFGFYETIFGWAEDSRIPSSVSYETLKNVFRAGKFLIHAEIGKSIEAILNEQKLLKNWLYGAKPIKERPSIFD